MVDWDKMWEEEPHEEDGIDDEAIRDSFWDGAPYREIEERGYIPPELLKKLSGVERLLHNLARREKERAEEAEKSEAVWRKRMDEDMLVSYLGALIEDGTEEANNQALSLIRDYFVKGSDADNRLFPTSLAGNWIIGKLNYLIFGSNVDKSKAIGVLEDILVSHEKIIEQKGLGKFRKDYVSTCFEGLHDLASFLYSDFTRILSDMRGYERKRKQEEDWREYQRTNLKKFEGGRVNKTVDAWLKLQKESVERQVREREDLDKFLSNKGYTPPDQNEIDLAGTNFSRVMGVLCTAYTMMKLYKIGFSAREKKYDPQIMAKLRAV